MDPGTKLTVELYDIVDRQVPFKRGQDQNLEFDHRMLRHCVPHAIRFQISNHRMKHESLFASFTRQSLSLSLSFSLSFTLFLSLHREEPCGCDIASNRGRTQPRVWDSHRPSGWGVLFKRNELHCIDRINILLARTESNPRVRRLLNTTCDVIVSRTLCRTRL